jgi:YVTN family beta-propeller protein
MARRTRTRLLTTVLFTDVVDSTRLASEMGDRRWRELMNRHNRAVRRELKRFGGREIDTAGDGFFATFQDPDSAIRCAVAITESVRDLGIEVRAGVHVGEAEVTGKQMRGIAVHIGARVMSMATGGQVFATGTVKELVTGAGLSFRDRGRHNLKGVDGEWTVLEVTDVEGMERTPPLEREEAVERREEIVAAPLIKQRLPLGLAAAAALAVVAAVVFLAVGEDGSLDSVPADSIGRIDAEGGELKEAFKLDFAPLALAVEDGVGWIVSLDSRTLTRLDPGEDKIGPSVATQGGPSGVAIDDSGRLWVVNQFEGTVVRIDPDRVRIDDSVDVGVGATAIAAGEGAVWVVTEVEPALIRIDHKTGGKEIVLDREDIEGSPQGVAVGGGSVWVAAGRTLLQVDPATRNIAGRSNLRFASQDLAFGEGFLWALHGEDDIVSKIDPGTLQAVAVTVGNFPTDVAVGAGSAWVTNGEDGTVSRIDPSSNEVLTIDVGESPRAVAIDDGSVFVAVTRR